MVRSPQNLPAILEPDREHGSCLHSLVRDQRENLHQILWRAGAILFRGFRPLAVPEFAGFASAFSGRPLLDYTGGASPRVKLGGGVYTSTEYPRDVKLSLHNELSYTFTWPEYLFFLCVTPAERGGETPIGDSRSILEKIDPEIVERFDSRGIRYERVLEDELASAYSWQAAFETDERSVVEEYCRGGDVGFEWNADGSLSLSEVRPATAVHPGTGDRVWFNQADGFHPSALGEFYKNYLSNPARLRLNAFYGDGGEIDVADLEHVRQVIRREMVPVSWRAGDILVVDNMLACHGRMPFIGERKVLLAMA